MQNTELVKGIDFKKEGNLNGTIFTFLTEKGVEIWKANKNAGTLFDLYDSLGIVPGIPKK
jgi:hypothetical protein